MTYSQLRLLLTDSGCSPEELGNLIGISGMTLRRWFQGSRSAQVPKLYLPAIREACFALIAQGRLSPSSPFVTLILAQRSDLQYEAALQGLGLSEGFPVDGTDSDQMLLGLMKIGSNADKRSDVERNEKKVLSFGRLSKEWALRVNTLWRVIRSKKLAPLDKVVAFGALFYLLTPLDFIPDQIPFFGLVDDFAVLGAAVAYYSQKFSSLT